MNYLFYDSTSGLPPEGTADYDLLYRNSWTTDDYLVVAERDGNTFFELTPLGVDGNPIDGANVLRFDKEYGWRSGYANAADSHNDQDMWFTATSVSTFFDGTDVSADLQFVYGYRIDNDGDADVKFFGASDDTFENNPKNPNVVPEPATFAFLIGLFAISLVACRRQR